MRPWETNEIEHHDPERPVTDCKTGEVGAERHLDSADQDDSGWILIAMQRIARMTSRRPRASSEPRYLFQIGADLVGLDLSRSYCIFSTASIQGHFR